MMSLKKIAAVMPDIVFKGGTSLSKCYHIIKRFSEDIDDQPPHTRDFSRELGGFLLKNIYTYGIINTWIKHRIFQYQKMLRMVVDMCILCSIISYGLPNIESPYS